MRPRLGFGVCPVSGWVDFDPTNNVQPALEHITLAWGRDFPMCRRCAG
jgi:transglutaminase-like putative cysteine protease